MAPLPESTAADMRRMMDEATADPHKIPGCVMAVVGKDGKLMFSHASGTRGIETKEKMTLDSVFWIARY